MKRIKKGDDVIVITGKDKGRRGTVLRVIDEDDRVLIEGVNMVRKHQKPNPNAGVQGGIVEQERAVHVSNVKLYNPVSGKGDRIGIKTLDDGRKVRFFKSNNEVVDV
jgi:large subunit ribosomal protein L24